MNENEGVTPLAGSGRQPAASTASADATAFSRSGVPNADDVLIPADKSGIVRCLFDFGVSVDATEVPARIYVDAARKPRGGAEREFMIETAIAWLEAAAPHLAPTRGER